MSIAYCKMERKCFFLEFAQYIFFDTKKLPTKLQEAADRLFYKAMIKILRRSTPPPDNMVLSIATYSDLYSFTHLPNHAIA